LLLGVEDGQTMRVTLGSSEVFITFRVKTSEKFRRDKEDIHSEINVSIVQAILGGAIKVPGIYEDHVLQVKELSSFIFFFLLTKFQIPPGTQSHQRFRLIGKGIKRLQSPGTGDHYVHIKIKIPTYVLFKCFSFIS
jgi:DnaJ family protein A protein 3